MAIGLDLEEQAEAPANANVILDPQAIMNAALALGDQALAPNNGEWDNSGPDQVEVRGHHDWEQDFLDAIEEASSALAIVGASPSPAIAQTSAHQTDFSPWLEDAMPIYDMNIGPLRVPSPPANAPYFIVPRKTEDAAKPDEAAGGTGDAATLEPGASGGPAAADEMGMDVDVYNTLGHLSLGERVRKNCWDVEKQPSVTANLFTPMDFPPLTPNQPAADLNTRRSQEDVERDEAFINDQLVPKSYLNSGIFMDLRPTNFNLELKSTLQQQTHAQIVFFIGAAVMKPLFEAGYFNTVIKSPTGRGANISMVRDERYPTRFRCSFRAVEPGPHWIHVCLGSRGAHHINNSPLQINVSRNYGTCTRSRAVLTRILSSIRNDMDAPGLTISPKCKVWGVASNPETEEIYAADRDGHEILVFSVCSGDLALKAKIRAPVPPKGLPFRPTGLAYDAVNKYLYATDKDNHRICLFQRNGNFLGAFGKEGHQNGEFSYPWGVAVSPDGELLAVADSRNHRIQLFNKNGCFIRKYSVFEVNPFEYKNHEIGFDYPRGICFSNDGLTIYVSDFNLHNIYAVDLDMRSKKTLHQTVLISRPSGLAVDACGNLLICEARGSGGGSVRVLNSAEGLMMTLQNTGSMKFVQPVDITVCRGDFICVVDMGGSRIRVF